MELNRSELCDFMNDIDKEVSTKNIEEQRQIVIRKSKDILEYLECREYRRENNFPAIQDICFSRRQIITYKNSVICLDRKQYLDAYWELFDFIHNHGSEDNPVINEGEYELLNLQLERMINS